MLYFSDSSEDNSSTGYGPNGQTATECEEKKRKKQYDTIVKEAVAYAKEQLIKEGRAYELVTENGAVYFKFNTEEDFNNDTLLYGTTTNEVGDGEDDYLKERKVFSGKNCTGGWKGGYARKYTSQYSL